MGQYAAVGALIVAALTIGCKGTSSADSEPDPAARCAAELAGWMAAALAEGRGFDRPRDLELARLDRPARRIEPAPLLVVGELDIELQGKLVSPVGDPTAGTALEASLSVKSERLAAALDRGTPWAIVAAISSAAIAARVTRLDLIVGARGELTAPRSELIEALAMTRPPAPAPRPPPQTLFDGCEPARALARSTGERPDLERVARFVADLPAALESCGCQVDREAARAIVWYWLDRYRGEPVAALSVELSAAGAPLVLDADVPWSTAVDSVARLAGPAQFAVSPESGI